VISPTNSTCNPGAHGVNLRCGTLEEQQQFLRQGTPALLGAIALLRTLPAALLAAGYRPPCDRAAGGHATKLQVPGVVLASAYPPGDAHYQRHLDCYGDDNARVLTLLLYANDANWDVAEWGGALQATVGDGREVEVAPRAGRVVVFDSKQIWHAVQPSRRLRFALTLWIFGAEANDDKDDKEAEGGQEGSSARPAPASAAATPTATEHDAEVSADVAAMQHCASRRDAQSQAAEPDKQSEGGEIVMDPLGGDLLCKQWEDHGRSRWVFHPG